MLRHPTLRLIAVALLLLGAHNASVYPYQSLIAFERIGMSKPAFSLLLVLASLVAVISSVIFGVLGDQFGHRRQIALVTAIASTIGISLILAFPGIWALILCQGPLLPLASIIYGQIFTLASADEGWTRDAVLGTIRSAMSFTFIATLIFWTFAFGFGLSELAVYVTGGLASLACRFWCSSAGPKTARPLGLIPGLACACATPWPGLPSPMSPSASWLWARLLGQQPLYGLGFIGF